MVEKHMTRGLGIFFGSAIAVAVFFGIAGTVTWWNAWCFFAFMGVIGVFTRRLIKTSPGLAEERKTAASRAKSWDVKLVRLINLALPAMLITAAFDSRFQWCPPVPVAASLAAFATMIPAASLTYRSMAANHYFSSHVRVQSDRGQVVVSSGPYRIVRHPGYAGVVSFNLLVPVALGSWAAFALGMGSAALLVYRTSMEDRVLMNELPGYVAYAAQVRNRLLPGIW